ncbi:hypothetical protein CHL67_09325 [Prosthecochloris sp. GSB1]|uniref:SO_0444 family Cu/Zn efflux transporter n=1 Tax=Prosthecochloris sp. GSB1 TaxID=281093 RepID=UPI000B8C9C5B|nr:SO_0444 family Cu/Zn efflux transporter [Prosthecochloris sp. GSB1]ASQ91089.1 hypothetical protein CHL67_09325 [Prosthecochloris sp. GSB1]
MTAVVATVFSIIAASWDVLLESAPWMLLGFFAAGLFRAFLPADFIAKHLGGNGLSGVVKASAFGVPVPLCSCGVLPAAAGLKERGAGKGPVASFLVSTPETGVDSIAVTYALLDPLMTVVRPVVSFVTAIAAGMAVSFSEQFGKRESPRASGADEAEACNGGSCSCGGKKTPSKESAGVKFRSGMAFAFGELLGDIGKWFLFGVLLAGCITVLVPPDLMAGLAGSEYLSMAAMLAVAIPLYVCATASTPIAAALALKGISPGAALVFLLAGPATNIASLTVVSRLLGKRAAGVYLLVIIVMSFAAGMLVNHLYGYLGLDITGWAQSGMHEENGVVEIFSALLLLALTFRAVFRAKD